MYCDFEACRTCCQTYITNNRIAKCMNNDCEKQWTRKFLVESFTKKFINHTWKQTLETIGLEKEKALLPATQTIVERQIERERIGAQINEVDRLIRELYQQRANLTNIHNQRDNTRAVEKKHFVRACPDEHCRGFLSTQWKCGLCDQWTCTECHVVKGPNRDTEHTCNPNDLETAKLLDTDTKPCPKCATGIYKIEGCFARDTSIRMWDGSIKMSQDIIENDILVGDDGHPRIVEQTVSGEDDLYEIKQNNGINYTVNSKHKLVLKFTGANTVHWHESLNSWKFIWFDEIEKNIKSRQYKVTNTYDKETAKNDAIQFTKSLNLNDVVEICVDDYLKLDKWSKQNLFGYKSGYGIDYDERNLVLDPYLLGLWLGDGTHTQPIIASNDTEIRDNINEWCKDNDAELVKDGKFKYRIRRKGFSFGRETVDGDVSEENQEVVDKTNPFTNLLKKYNLIGNKHIPYEFMVNSRENRLKLIAGIIDTDGHVPQDQCGKRVVIIQSNEELSKQIILLSKSLGFVVNYKVRERKNVSIFGGFPKDYKNQYIINISGENLGEIPTILPRKKCIGTVSNKDYLRTNIEVVHVGKGNYYGWSVNENKRFLLDDFTVVRNCDQMWCTQCHTAFSWRTGRIETHIHNPHYYEWQRRNNGGVAPRNVGDFQCGREINHYTARQINDKVRNTYMENNHCSQYSRTSRYHDDRTNFPSETPVMDKLTTRIDNMVRSTLHIQRVQMPTYQVDPIEDNILLRVDYLRNRISEEEFKVKIQRANKQHQKKREIGEIIHLFVQSTTDILYRVHDCVDNKPKCKTPEEQDILHTQMNTILDEINTLVEYTDECFVDIAKTYGCKQRKIRIYNDRDRYRDVLVTV